MTEIKLNYERKGYVHSQSVLSAKDVTDTRHFITNKFNESGKDLSDFQYLINKYKIFHDIFSEKIDRDLREINDQKEIYFLNVIKIQKNAAVGSKFNWHQDSGGNKGKKYFTNKENFYCKMGIYLQDNSAVHGGGIDLVPYSHLIFIDKKLNILKKFFLKIYTSIRIRFFNNRFKIKKGDAVFFHNKLFHKTSNIKKNKDIEEYLKKNNNINLYVLVCNKSLIKEIFKFNNLEFDEEKFKKEYTFELKQKENSLSKFILNDYITQLIFNSLSD